MAQQDQISSLDESLQVSRNTEATNARSITAAKLGASEPEKGRPYEPHRDP